MRRIAVTLSVILTASCSSFTDVEDFETLEDFRALPERVDGPTVEATAGALSVVGVIRTPDPCHTLSGRLRREGRTLTLRVVARRWGPHACIQVIGEIGYRVRIDGLDPGDYQVHVLHVYPAAGWPESVITREVTIGR